MKSILSLGYDMKIRIHMGTGVNSAANRLVNVGER